MQTLTLQNDLYDRNLSLDCGGGISGVVVPFRKSKNINFTLYQYDELFLDTMATYVKRGDLIATYEGRKLSVADIESMRGVGLSALYAG